MAVAAVVIVAAAAATANTKMWKRWRQSTCVGSGVGVGGGNANGTLRRRLHHKVGECDGPGEVGENRTE